MGRAAPQNTSGITAFGAEIRRFRPTGEFAAELTPLNFYGGTGKMDYSVFKETLTSLSDGSVSVLAELIASSSETIPYYSDVSDRLLAPGSIAIVPSESAIYILDVDLLWTDWSNGNKLPAPSSDDDDDDDEDDNNENGGDGEETLNA